MKYLLIENAEGNEPRRVTIFDTVDERARATRACILGPPTEENKDLPCPELLILARDGTVAFEGDPSLEWVDAEIEIVERLIQPNRPQPLDANGKRPYLFYYEDAVNCWAPVPELTENFVNTDMLADGDTMEIEFKRKDMTPEEFAKIPEV